MPSLERRIAAKRNSEIGVETSFDDKGHAQLGIELNRIRCPYCNTDGEPVALIAFHMHDTYAIEDLSYKCDHCGNFFELEVTF